MAQLMPLPLTVSCFSKIQIGFTFLVPAHPGSPGQSAVKCVCVCACVRVCTFSANDGSLYVYDRQRNERTLRVGVLLSLIVVCS